MTVFDAQALRSALAGLDAGNGKAPRPLQPLLDAFAVDPGGADLNQLATYLDSCDAAAPERMDLHLALARWDASPVDLAWASGTAPQTWERRSLVIELLGLPHSVAVATKRLFPVAGGDDGFVIARDHEVWYDLQRRTRRTFYWTRYERYLIEDRGWDPQDVQRLDRATSSVVERLSDPSRPASYQAKGLVVGYVQSGKTANFTGVLAKSVDAGYRLIIVLTGTIDLLRKQTQRRLDKEFVGFENIVRGIDLNDPEMAETIDYRDDEEWIADRFVRHGVLPSSIGQPAIIRLTRHDRDYQGLGAGITALELEKRDKTKPLFDLVNLDGSDARLAIVKKNSRVLAKLVKDLRKVKAHLPEIPTLIIDDESDQASVDTLDPAKKNPDKDERSKINGHIADLLRLLPRAQYVGYTATPFANVFVDPQDDVNIFPKDFLVGLERPRGYMGGSDFHDLDSPLDESQKTVANSWEKAYVRSCRATDDAGRVAELAGALDAFVLSGAVKLFRESQGTKAFRHHTMLVHESVTQVEHKLLAEQIQRLWAAAGYTTPAGLARLRDLYERDFLPVMQTRGELLPRPTEFTDLKAFVGSVLQRLGDNGNNPVIIVNGDKDIEQEHLDFDARPVWRILVGGTKLSRGFTVEGLTVSYYRRKAGTADTLMQMGRWFGYRPDYHDLVRLYVGRAEGRTRNVDLYEAFEAAVRDEEAFRAQLLRYAKPETGKPLVTPLQIPPLVSQHLPGLRPASRNKMFNAVLEVRRSPGLPIEPTGYPQKPTDIATNYDRMLPVLQAATHEVTLDAVDAGGQKVGRFGARLGTIGSTELIGIVRELQWIDPEDFAPDLAYLFELGHKQLVDDWLIISPQQARAGRPLPGVGDRAVFLRKRRLGRNGRFGPISEPKHRPAAELVAGARAPYGDVALAPYLKARRGAVLLYPVVEDKALASHGVPQKGQLVVAFTLTAPRTALDVTTQVVTFRVRNPAKPESPVVDVVEESSQDNQ